MGFRADRRSGRLLTGAHLTGRGCTDGDGCALAGEAARNRRADAVRAASDQSDATSQLVYVGPGAAALCPSGASMGFIPQIVSPVVRRFADARSRVDSAQMVSCALDWWASQQMWMSGA